MMMFIQGNRASHFNDERCQDNLIFNAKLSLMEIGSEMFYREKDVMCYYVYVCSVLKNRSDNRREWEMSQKNIFISHILSMKTH